MEGKEKEIENFQNELKNKSQEIEEFKLSQLNEMNVLEDEKINLTNSLEAKEKEIKILNDNFEKEKNFHIENYNANKLQIEELDLSKGNMEREIKQLKEIFDIKKNELDNLNAEYIRIKDSLDKSLVENTRLLKDIEDSKTNFNRLISAKEEIIENFEKKFSEKEEIYIKEEIYLKEKIEELEKKMVQKDLMVNQLKLDLENKKKDVIIIKEDLNNRVDTSISCNNENISDINKLQNETIEIKNINNKVSEDLEKLKSEYFNKESELIEKISNLESQKEILDKDLIKKGEKLNELTEVIKSLDKDTEKFKKKSKELENESENLREIIAKDQLRIKELKEFKEWALEGKIDLSNLNIQNYENKISQSNDLNSESIKISEYNILLDKLKDEKSKSKVLCDEFRKLQENISTLKFENSKKEKVIEANIKMIEELKVRLRNKIKLDEIIIQNKNKEGVSSSNIGICYNCSNQINNVNNNNFRSFSITSSSLPNLELQRTRSQSTIYTQEQQNSANKGNFVSIINPVNSSVILNNNNNSNNFTKIASKTARNENTNNENKSKSYNTETNQSNSIKSDEEKSEGKIRVTFEQFNLCKLLIVENLILNYQLSQSISLNFVIEVLLKNFNFLLNTIFINENQNVRENHKKQPFMDLIKPTNNINKNNNKNNNFGYSVSSSENSNDSNNGNSNNLGLNQISIFHEFLEDIVLKIYDIASKNKNFEDNNSNKNEDENKNNNKDFKKENNVSRFGKTLSNLFSFQNSNKQKNDSPKNPISSNISKDDFSFELINKITSEIAENNIIHNLVNAQRPSKPTLQELFYNFKQKFEKYFDYEFLNISDKNTKYFEVVNINLEDYLNNEIKSILIENLSNYNLNSKNKISLLIDKISQNIEDGVLFNSINKLPLYDFKNFDKEYSQFNFILRNSQNLIIDEKNSFTEEDSENSVGEKTLLDDLKCENQIIKISDIIGFSTKKNIKNTFIINLSNIDKILFSRHSFDYFSFLIKSQNSDLKKIIFKGDIKKNINLRSIYTLFLNILLYNKNINALKFTDVYLSSDTQIRENESLRRLSIYKEPINQSLLELVNFLNYSHNIRYLNISNCFIGDEGLKFLCKNFTNYSIIEINLTKNHLKENSGFYLADFIPKLRNLESLILADNSITDPGLTALATAISLMNQGSLRYLDLSNNSIGENESRSFVDFIQKYQNLKELNLSRNTLTSPAANSIGIYLKLVKGLIKIDLTKCELNEESSPLLIKNLDSSAIENIILDSNPLGQVGAILLANMLRINKNIKTISLNNCWITGMGITLLAKNCENNTVLKEIDLRNNKLNNEEYKMLKKLLEGKTYKFLLDEEEKANL